MKIEKIWFNNKELTFVIITDYENYNYEEDIIFRDEMRLNIIHQIFTERFCRGYLK